LENHTQYPFQPVSHKPADPDGSHEGIMIIRWWSPIIPSRSIYIPYLIHTSSSSSLPSLIPTLPQQIRCWQRLTTRLK